MPVHGLLGAKTPAKNTFCSAIAPQDVELLHKLACQADIAWQGQGCQIKTVCLTCWLMQQLSSPYWPSPGEATPGGGADQLAVM